MAVNRSADFNKIRDIAIAEQDEEVLINLLTPNRIVALGA
jgi:hypothetical protein